MDTVMRGKAEYEAGSGNAPRCRNDCSVTQPGRGVRECNNTNRSGAFRVITTGKVWTPACLPLFPSDGRLPRSSMGGGTYWQANCITVGWGIDSPRLRRRPEVAIIVLRRGIGAPETRADIATRIKMQGRPRRSRSDGISLLCSTQNSRGRYGDASGIKGRASFFPILMGHRYDHSRGIVIQALIIAAFFIAST